jgi:hypothetical protein
MTFDTMSQLQPEQTRVGRVFKINGRRKMAWHWATTFGLRWQSEAATALLTEHSSVVLFPKRRRASLAAAVQNVYRPMSF